jgi:hypothetical protein
MSGVQLGLEIARAEGEVAMNACMDAAEHVAPGVAVAMYAFLVRWAMQRERGERFTAEAISDAYAADVSYVQPRDQRAWGSVITKALNARVLRWIDNNGVRRKGHGSKGCKRYVSCIVGKRATEVLER